MHILCQPGAIMIRLNLKIYFRECFYLLVANNINIDIGHLCKRKQFCSTYVTSTENCKQAHLYFEEHIATLLFGVDCDKPCLQHLFPNIKAADPQNIQENH